MFRSRCPAGSANSPALSGTVPELAPQRAPEAQAPTPEAPFQQALYVVGKKNEASRPAALPSPAEESAQPAFSNPEVLDVPVPIPGSVADKSARPAVPNVEASKPGLPPLAPATVPGPVPDTVVKPAYGHANDYHWLNGQVQYSRISKAWRLRYAPLDEIDPYGGSVTLVDDGTLGSLKDGQYVRVHGQLVSSPDKAVAPPYKVDSVQTAQ